jgi:two-component system NtrC family sensor kinase
MKLYLKLLLLIFLPIIGKAQQSYPDSLKHALATAKTDSARYATLGDLTYYYAPINAKTALNYVNERLLITLRNKNHELDESATLIMKGFILLLSNKYTGSLTSLEQALKIAEDPENSGKAWKRKGFPDAEQARIDIIANVHLSWGHLMGQTDSLPQQMAQYKLTYKFAKEAGDTGLVGWAESELGWDYLQVNKVDSALILANQAEPIIEKDYKQLFGQVGIKRYIDINDNLLGRVHLLKHDDKLALDYFRKGIYDGITQVDLSNVIGAYFALSDYYLSAKQPDSSLYYTKGAIAILRRTGSADIAQAFKYADSGYKMKHELDSAYKYEDLAMAAQGSSFETSQQNLSDFQKQSFREQILLRDQEKERAAIQTRKRIILLLAGIAALVLLTIVFYRNYKKTQIANKLLHQQKQEIQNTLSQLKGTQMQLIQREKMASLGELTAGIAHEIQNPLNFVNNFSEVSRELMSELGDELKKGDLAEVNAIAADINENLQKIAYHGKRADSIVKGMLEHSKQSSGVKELIDINHLADEYLRLAYSGFLAKNKPIAIALVTNFDNNLPKILISGQDIGRVLLNIFNNAFYTVNQKAKTAADDYKPQVTVTTALQPALLGTGAISAITIIVKDNGNGIPEAIKDKIMQPFFTTKPTGEGTGLGLSLSYDIVVKGYNGKIDFISEDGEGSTFTVILPG